MPRPVILGPRAGKNTEGKLARVEPLTPVEFDADTLVRHAFVCGASGFGKTVFCKGLVEESVRAGIPVVAIDLKGDLASLALTGRYTRAEELKKVFGDEEGAQVAAEYEGGADKHGLNRELADDYATKAHIRLFTPNSSLGRRVALSALPSFSEPPNSALEREERDELVQALVLGFAHSMYGSPAAVKKNEPAVKVIEELVRWCAQRGEALEGAAGISRLLDLVREPPFESMGGMPLDQYLPVRDKQRLMQKLNSRLLGAERSRYEGPRLSIETLLDDVPEGKTALSIVYLGHISDFTEQASIVGLLCADVYRWMRKTGGSSGVRLMMYVDELGGGDAKHAFYPSAPHNPPSKAPLNLLVRQGRSAGIAMLLATQNPMSVDVRGLGNINTWAIGRLTRKNDHLRVEDLLSRLPPDPAPTQVVSQLPQGIMLTMSDYFDGPQYVCGRWLYSIHRQLAPGAVGAISQLTDERPPEPVVAPPPPWGAPRDPALAEPPATPPVAGSPGAGRSSPPGSAPGTGAGAGTPSGATRTSPTATRAGQVSTAGPLELDDVDYDLVPVEPLEYEDTLAPDDFDLDDLEEDEDGTPVPASPSPLATRRTRSKAPKASEPPSSGTGPGATATGSSGATGPAAPRVTPPPAPPRAAPPDDDLHWDLADTPKPPFGRHRGRGRLEEDEPARKPASARKRSRSRTPASETAGEAAGTPTPAPERSSNRPVASDPSIASVRADGAEATRGRASAADPSIVPAAGRSGASAPGSTPSVSSWSTSGPAPSGSTSGPASSGSGSGSTRSGPPPAGPSGRSTLSEQTTLIRPVHPTPSPAPTRGKGPGRRSSANAALPPASTSPGASAPSSPAASPGASGSTSPTSATAPTTSTTPTSATSRAAPKSPTSPSGRTSPEPLDLDPVDTVPRKTRKPPSRAPRSRKGGSAEPEPATGGAGELVYLPVEALEPPPSAEVAPTPPAGPDRLMEEAETSEYPPLDAPITGGGFELVDPPEDTPQTPSRSRSIRFEPPTTSASRGGSTGTSRTASTTSSSTLVPEEPTHAGPTLRLVSSEVDPSGETDAVHTLGARAAEPTTRRRAHDPGEEHTSAGPTLRLARSEVDPSEETDAVHTAAARAADPTALRPVVTRAARPVEEDDTGALLAETGVRPRALGLDEVLGDPTHTAWVPDRRAKEDQTSWVPGPASGKAGTPSKTPSRPSSATPPGAPKRTEEGRDDGESMTLTFARPAVAAGPSGWIVKHGTRAWPVPTDKPLKLGRSRDADVRIEDPHVSGDHLELRIDGKALVVRERIAKNKTTLDGAEIVGDVRIEPARRTWTLRLADVEVLVSWSAPLPGSRR